MNPNIQIDATEPEMQEISQRYGVTGYPTLKLVRNGEVTDWKGESLYESYSMTHASFRWPRKARNYRRVGKNV